jgi:hypothetical protein
MRFKNIDDRLAWLKSTAAKIYEMEQQRRVAILQGDFFKATSLLKGIKFATNEFRKCNLRLRKESVCKK